MIVTLNEKDRALRKLWFWVTAVFFTVDPNLFLGFIANLFFPHSNLLSSASIYSAYFGFQAAFIGEMFLSLIWICTLLHCAYKKPGTKLLSFMLFVSYIAIPFCVIFYFFSAFILIQAGSDLFWEFPLEALGLLLTILQLVVNIWWVCLTLQYRRLNKKIQAQSHPDYLDRLQALKSASSRESLDEQFSALKKHWPQFKLLTRHEYKLRKAQL